MHSIGSEQVLELCRTSNNLKSYITLYRTRIFDKSPSPLAHLRNRVFLNFNWNWNHFFKYMLSTKLKQNSNLIFKCTLLLLQSKILTEIKRFWADVFIYISRFFTRTSKYQQVGQQKTYQSFKWLLSSSIRVKIPSILTYV